VLDFALLFASAFLSATLLPAQSELLLAHLSFQGVHSAFLLVLVATVGNVSGSLVNWWMGRMLSPAKRSPMLIRAETLYHRFGIWSLLFAWIPFIGDPLTLIAGVFHTPLRLFLPLVACGKALRYTIVMMIIA
jgi:membrane protein YqaA with SNARE-associated domain